MEPKPFCACGCGQRITSKKPKARFISGHNARVATTWRGKLRGWQNQPEPIWDGDCLRWRGAHSAAGYGTYGAVLMHRLVWELFNGPIPLKMTIDHVYDQGCRHRDCIRVAHMEVVTQAENSSRNLSARALRAKTHCPKGHEYTPENTRVDGVSRKCKTCIRAQRRVYEERLRRQKGVPPRNFTKRRSDDGDAIVSVNSTAC